MRTVLKIAALVLVLWGLTLCMQRDVLGSQLVDWPRFHRSTMVRVDDATHLDVIKDVTTGICRLVYRARQINHSVSVAYLGEVPCQPTPIFVPPPLVASPVK